VNPSPSKKNPERELTHLDEEGRARMVDVTDKPKTDRRAVARGRIAFSRAGWRALDSAAGTGKGDALAVAQVSAVQAAKRTGDWIPLAHPLPLTSVEVRWKRRGRSRVLEVEVGVRTHGRTGVEMEALTAVSAALLTVYDMLKAADHGMRIGPVWLSGKSGGRRGTLAFEDPPLALSRPAEA
jgi:cyclic pyranopterin phosphate synthase